MIKLVACDIDGTLLINKAERIPEDAMRQIARITEKGILFCPCSGRQYESIQGLFAPLNRDMYCIIENGSAIYAPGSGLPLDVTAPPREDTLEICADIIARKDCEVLISTPGKDYICLKDESLIGVMHYFLGEGVGRAACPGDVKDTIIKVAAYCKNGPEEPEKALGEKWRARGFTVARGGPDWLDFTVTDKGEGLKKLCSRLGISQGEVMAIGDSYNDAPMLDFARRPYIMEKAERELLDRYKNHCRNVAETLAAL